MRFSDVQCVAVSVLYILLTAPGPSSFRDEVLIEH